MQNPFLGFEFGGPQAVFSSSIISAYEKIEHHSEPQQPQTLTMPDEEEVVEYELKDDLCDPTDRSVSFVVVSDWIRGKSSQQTHSE